MPKYLIAIILLIVSSLSFAQNTYPPTEYWRYGTNDNTRSPTPEGACLLIPINPLYTYSHYVLAADERTGTCFFEFSGTFSQPSISKIFECSNGGYLQSLSGGARVCRKDCPAGEPLQQDGTCGVPRCSAGSIPPGGLGSIAAGSGSEIPDEVCVDGCMFTAGGLGVGGSQGWAVEIGRGTGASCEGNSFTAPADSPEAECTKKGMEYGTINGVTVCTNKAPQSTTTGSKESTTTTTTTDSNGNTSSESSSTRTDTTTTRNPDGSTTTTTTTTTTHPDGSTSSSTTSTTTTGKGGGSGSGSGSGIGGGSGSGSGNGSGDGEWGEEEEKAPGEAAGTGDLYTKNSRTITDSFNDFTNQVKGAPFYQAASNFFTISVPGGGCSGLSGSVSFMGRSVSINMTEYFCGSSAQIVYNALSVGLLVVATWLAFKIAFL